MHRALPFFATAIAAIAWPMFATPQRASDSGRAAAQVREYLEAWRKEAAFPGVSVGVVLNDGRPIAVTAGVADREAQTPMRADDLLLAGSTGKTFFAAVAVQLIEAGMLDLDAPISKYLGSRPWFRRLPNANDITVRHLMTHTSGLVRYEMNPAFTADLRAQPDKVWTPEEEIAYLFDATPPFAAGQGWDYSDTNYIVLGTIVESITGTKLYDEVQRRFLTPLALTKIVPSTSRRIPGLAPGYAGPRDPLGLPDRVVVDGQFVINPQFEWTGGGYATSAGDLARWGHELYAGRAISAKARALMIDAAVPARLGPETKYGLGVIVRPSTPIGLTWGHSGFFPGYQTELVHAAASGVTVAVQVNTSAPRATGNRSPLRAAYDIAAIAAGSAGAAQATAAPPAPARGLVTVDVAVVDADGRPVPNLTAADFRVAAGGVDRRVVSAEYVTVPRRSPSTGSTAPLSPTPPRSSTNTGPFAGRTTLFVADVGYIPENAGGDVIAAIGKHLDSLDPADRVGFIDVPLGTPRVDPTTDHQAFRDETRQVTGISNRWRETTMTYGEASRIHDGDASATLTYWRRTNGGARGCNARMPKPYAAPPAVSPDCQQAADRALERYRRETQSRLDTLRGMIAPMSTLDGQKVLVFVSGGLLMDPGSRDALVGLAEMAERGRVAVYALQVDQTRRSTAEPDQATAALDDRVGFDGLAEIASLARGAAFRLSSTPEAILVRLDAELSGYYTIAFARTTADLDDHRVEMDVRVSRPGLEVRSRRAFTPGATAGPATAETDLHTRIDEMIKRPIGWTGVGLDVAAYPLVAASRDEVSVTIAVELDRPMKNIAAVGYEIASIGGKVVVDAFEASPGLRNLGSRALFTTTVDMRPGRYRLKVAAIDSDGGRGSLEHRFDVAEPAESGVRVSEVLLGDDSTGQFRPVVRVAPDLPSIVARVELAASATALNGLGAAVTIAPRGQAMRASDAVAVPIVTMQGSQRRFAAGRVDLRSLPPGEYVITVVITSPAGEVARRARLFEK